MSRYTPGEDFRWNFDRPVEHDDFNGMNDAAIFDGAMETMQPAITANELRILMERGEELTVVDVLDRDSYTDEHICGAINIPVERLEREAGEILPDKNEVLIVYGRSSGSEASVAADKLNTLMYANVLKLAEGIERWKTSGYCTAGKLAGFDDEESESLNEAA